eukprot:scaffold279775_cov28-Tisochrysis_lutea.AAC.1
MATLLEALSHSRSLQLGRVGHLCKLSTGPHHPMCASAMDHWANNRLKCATECCGARSHGRNDGSGLEVDNHIFPFARARAVDRLNGGGLWKVKEQALWWNVGIEAH